MKKRILSLMTTLILSVVLFTSCLGDGSSKTTSEFLGILTTGDNFMPMFNVGVLGGNPEYIYAPELDTYSLTMDMGGCYYFLATWDSKDQTNSKYTIASLGGAKPIKIDDGDFMPSIFETDTTTLRDREIPIVSAVSASEAILRSPICVVGDRVVLGMSVKQNKDSKIRYTVQYDGGKRKPIIDNEGRKIYEFYLIAEEESADSNAKDNSVAIRAFRIGQYIYDLANIVESKEFYIRFKYKKEFNKEDAAKFSWGQSEPILVNWIRKDTAN